ncbi:putative bifunctional diguanylate cyclase/phosphodiesterase [Zobellella maritima]|uniref:putative bifunctional diguanylate cyclase/phosphodiesterase n=1 Tax=Zobellella maritima TaxID=2059725 RepID=UPI000E307CD5|nr:EAL domain-containing protein [Zobellella maritima]
MTHLKLVLLLVISLVFGASSIYSYNRDIEVVRFVSGTVKGIGWASSELEMELLKFDHALEQLASGAAGVDNLQLRFELLWSRIDVLQEGKESAPLRERPEAKALLDALEVLLIRLDERVFSLQGGDIEGIRAIQRELATFRQQARQFNVSSFSGSDPWRQLDVTHNLRVHSLGYLGGLLLSGGLMLFLLFRENRRNLHLAYHDALTGLPNRAHFYQQMEQAIDRTKREKGKLAVHMIDLNNFKEINDGLGHETGDQLLCIVAERLHRCVNNTGTIARIGGDEFIVIQERVSGPDDALQMALRLRHALSREAEMKGAHLTPFASIGTSLYPDHGQEVVGLLGHADTAMYYAKTVKNGSARLFTTDMDEQRLRRQRMAVALKRALESDQLCLHYQPIFRLDSLEVESVEALLRWQPSDYGRVNPLEVIQVAEQHGLAQQLNEWVLNTACRQLAYWHEAGFSQLKVNVNISPNIFAGGQLASTVASTLAATGVPADSLVLEITEDTSLWDTSSSLETLASLRELGVGIALDDFGTGYSSFSHLRQLPINKLKIDKSFVQDLPTDPKAVSLVKTIIELAHNLGMKVTAEGIEEESHLRILKQLGCDLAQGYFLTRPAAAILMTQYLKARPLILPPADRDNQMR